jgi:MYXO-CTERM domain-containing protein
VPASRFPRFLMSSFAVALLAGGAAGATESAMPGVAHAPVSNAAGATAQYYGGVVTPNAKVYVVWWGDPSKINSAVTAAKGGIADFFAGVTNSSFMDGLNQYSTNINATAGSKMGSAGTGQYIGRGNYAGTFTLMNVPSGTSITDAQIQTALDAAFDAGTLPEPDDNAIYAVYFPQGLSITLDGSKSCSAFGAYHEAILETKRHNAIYLVMPDCGSSFAGWCSVSTHELVEAMTDNIPTPGSMPDYPQAWNDAMGNEMGDLCNGNGTVNTDFGTFTVQTIWDERTKTCKAFSSDAKDFNVAVSPNVATVSLNAPMTLTVKTAASVGAAESLTLSVTAPTGFTATVTPTTVMSGGTAALTVKATTAAPATGVQIIVRADAMGTPVQTHTAALLLTTSSVPADLGAEPADMAAGAPDLAEPSTGGNDGDDMATGGGSGGNGEQPGMPKGCGCVLGGATPASTLDGTWLPATLLLVAFVLLASRRRRQRA